ncbi:uncharacterized protein N7477_003395 [Penicillium maclennaniae]|uniref:uncharacterized protein n=1 Tax=Penicillium maclennaniae TaxID=1343394 RepID=UPI002540F0ED|nr:uncharacterized protein N7477_003395 [Penicillium maclennaniae]KAJ5677762.1 hypothetical protein N7477_003395 [Penicillium maclennaniae]
MDDLSLEDIVRKLSDLEVALYLCLVAREHCLIETTRDGVHDLAKELALICSNTFDLSYSILDCSATTSIGDIQHEILTADARKSQERPSYFRLKTESSSNLSLGMTPRDRSKSPIPSPLPTDINAVNVVIAKDFNLVDDDVQGQVLQLMRTKKLVTESGFLNAPGDFLFIALVTKESDQLRPPLKLHLNEQLLISHYHDPSGGYLYLEENEYFSDSQLSACSVIHTPKTFEKNRAKIDHLAINKLREASSSVTTSAEVVRYIQDIVVFLRLSRAVAGGGFCEGEERFRSIFQVSFDQRCRYLAPLHGIDYLTPSIVALAARKVFRHRIIVANPEDDRSLQYGSGLRAVSSILIDVTPDSILDGVLALEPPI